MIQLTFQPAFDPFHALYRILRLFPTIKQHGPLHHDQVRILDYFLLFPHRTSIIRIIQKHRRFKGLAAKYAKAKPYGEQPDDHTLFERMGAMQTAALQTLAKQGFIDPEALQLGMVKVTGLEIPEPLKARTTAANEIDNELMEFLALLAVDLPLGGANGLKDRTGLLEHRYDTV